MSWEKAQKIYKGERTSWDEAYSVYQQESSIAIETPGEARKTGIEIQDLSIEQAIPISDIEENLDEMRAWRNNELFDPTEPPKAKIAQELDYDIDFPFLEIDEDMQKRSNEIRNKKNAVIQEYFGVDTTGQFKEVKEENKLDIYPPAVADPDEPVIEAPEQVKPTLQDIVTSLPTEDIKYIINSTFGTKALPKELDDLLVREYRVREFMENLKNHSQVRQAEIIAGLTFTNIFNLPEWTSRVGIHPIEIITNEKQAQSIALEASARVLAEKNEIDSYNVARIANIGAGVLRTALEFWMTPGATALSKVPAGIRPLVQTGIKFATHDALVLPRKGETITDKSLSVTESFMLGFGIGTAGKFIPKARFRVPIIVSGFSALTYARTGDIEAAIETGITVLGFEAVGLMQQSLQYSRQHLRNTYAARAVKSARTQNPELFKFTNKEVANILEKQARNFSDHTGRDLSHKNAREEVKRAWAQKQQGNEKPWRDVMTKFTGQQQKRVEGQPLTVPVEAKPIGKPIAALPPAQPPAVGVKPTPAVVAPEKPAVVRPVGEIAVPEKVVKPEIEPKPLPTKEVVAEKKKLPPHLQVVADRAAEIERQKGFTITDVTPEGFGPVGEIGRPVLEGLKGETLDQAIARNVGFQIDNGIVKLEETHDGWKATIGTGEDKSVFSATKKQSVLNQVQEFLNPDYKFIPAQPSAELEVKVEIEKVKPVEVVAEGKIEIVDSKTLSGVGNEFIKTLNLKGKVSWKFEGTSEDSYANWKKTGTDRYEITIHQKDYDVVRSQTALKDTMSHELTHLLRGEQDKPKQLAYHTSDFYRDWDKVREKLGLEITPISELTQPHPTFQPAEAIKVPAPPAELEVKVEAPPKQIKEVTEKIPEARIAEPITARAPVTVQGKKFYPVTLPTEEIGVDPKKFQFKLGAKLAGGVTEALKDIEIFDPVKGGQILVWQDKTGKHWVVDGHHRVALAKKTGAESLDTWVIREADGVTAADARAIGALRNLADGKGTAIDAAKLFRDSEITLAKLKKQGVPTENLIVKQGMDMKNLSDYVFRLVVDDKLPPSFAAPIGRQVTSDVQQKQVADLIMEGEIDTVRQAELLAATIDTAPVLTKSEQTLFGVEITEKSLYAERAKVLANVEKKLKINKKVFGILAIQTGIIEAKGNILQKVENLAAKEQAEEVLFMLEKLANAKGPIAEALNDATKEYAKNPTKENLTKVTNRLLEQWTEGPARLRISEPERVQQLPLERVGRKAVEKPTEPELIKPEDLPVSPRPLVNPKASALEQDKQLRAQQAWDKKHPGGFIDVKPLAKVHEAFMSIIEPSKAVELAQGKDVYAEVITAIHKPDVAMIDFNEKELEHLDRTLGEWGKALSKYPNRILELLMLSRGKPKHPRAIQLQNESLAQLMKEAPELVGTRKMINRASDFNHDYLREVVGDEVGYIEDYFYGVYKDPRKVENFIQHWKTTKRFTKEKKWFTAVEAKAIGGLDLRYINPVDNLRAEYMAIARLDGMIGLKDSLMKSGEGQYIDKTELAPIEWDKVQDPVFADVRVAPELAKMINNLISTNKITRQPILNTVRQINNFLRTVKFIGSAFHLGVIAKQAMADSGYLGFLRKRTTLRGLTIGFRKSDPIFQTPEYKDYILHGGGHRFSVDSEAQKAFSNAMDKVGKAGLIAKGVALPFQIPEKFVRWMFENYIPKVKYSKYLDTVSEQEKKLGRSLKSAEKIDIVKEAQNFYGMMNERLFGRSGTVTTVLRLKFMAPGFAEGNFRSILKAILQWGGKEGFKASRSRANIINSFIISAIAATVGTLFLTGKPPKKPEKLMDIRDLFKIDTGKVDQHGRKIMIDMLTYDKDYWDVFGNILIGQPGKAVETTIKRLGGMTATTWEVLSDLNQMSMGKAVYDWKGDRVVEITDPFILKVLKLAIHELKKAEPISSNVFQQARQKGVGIALSAAMTLAGARLTTSEQDKREMIILNQIWSLRDQQEALFWYLGTIKNPREQIKRYNQTVMRILDNPITPLSFKDEYESKLIIDEKRLTSNKVYNFLGDKARLAEYLRSPEKYPKEIKELREDIERGGKWLSNFEISEAQYRSYLVTYEKLHRKILKEIQPEDNLDDLKNDLAGFYADQTFVKRKIQSGLGNDRDRRSAKKYTIIGNNISEVARRIYETENEDRRENLFNRIQTVIDRTK